MNKPCTWLILILLAFLLSFSHASGALAQPQATAASMEGTVYDPTGAVIPGVTVMVTNQATGLTRTVTTRDNGRYLIPLLPSGSYTVSLTKEGFAELKFEQVELLVGDTRTLDGHMQPASLREEAIVVAADSVPLIEPTRTEPGTVIDRRVIEYLPLNGRNWTELVLLTPGVTNADDFGNVSFGGVERVYNNVMVDGADNNNAFFGEIRGRTRAPFQFSQETVKEFRVGNSTFSAEFGRAGGGIVNAITRSGTNDFHGTGFYWLRDDALNANNFFNNASGIPRPPERRQQFGFNVGFPIIRDKLFYFLNYDHQRRTEPVGVILGAQLDNDIASLRGAERAQVEAFFRPLVRAVPREFNQLTFFPRFDYHLNQNHNFTLTHNFQQFSSPNGVFTQPTTDNNTTANAKNITRSYSTVVTANSVLTSKLINEFRFQFVFDDTADFANAPFLPQIRISGFDLGSRDFLHSRPEFKFPGRFTFERRQQWVDNFSILLGNHTIKTGLDINRVKDINFFASRVSGNYSFGGVSDFLVGNVSSFQQRFFTISPEVTQVTVDYGFYAQDSFRVNRRLTLYYGVRYELQTLPEPILPNPLEPRTAVIPEDRNNVAPRFGFAYDPFADGKTVIRGGYGFFYGRQPNQRINDALTNNNAASFNVFISGSDAPSFGLIFPPVSTIDPLNLAATHFPVLSAPPGGLNFSDPFSDVTVFSSNLVQPYFQQANFEVEREIFPRTTVTLTYLFNKGTHIARSRNVNIFPPSSSRFNVVNATLPDGRTVTLQIPSMNATRVSRGRRFNVPNPNFRQILEVESAANSIYHGFALKVNRRFSRGFQLLASYTLSKNIDDIRNALGVFSDILDPFNSRLDRARSDLDQRQRLTISSIWEMPFFKKSNKAFLRKGLGGWSLSGIATFASGRPITPNVSGSSSATDFNDDNVTFDRAPVFGRNTFTGPGRNQIDLSLRKTYRINERRQAEFVFQAFDVFNRSNFATVQSFLFNTFRAGNTFTLVPRPENDFLQPTSALRGRDLQFGFKFSF